MAALSSPLYRVAKGQDLDVYLVVAFHPGVDPLPPVGGRRFAHVERRVIHVEGSRTVVGIGRGDPAAVLLPVPSSNVNPQSRAT